MRLPFMRSRSRPDPTVVDALERIEDRLDRLIAIGERTNEFLEGAERQSAPQPAQTDVPDQPEDPRATERTSRSAPTQGPRRRLTKSTGGRRQRAAKRADRSAPVEAPVKLHEAIIRVLLDAREPLTANDLAARIRERNLFEPPRSGHELRGGQVSARVGNSHYRDRFVRRDGRIWLADPEGERRGRTVT